jgi:tetratricopeptide (TPR) repeat protein
VFFRDADGQPLDGGFKVFKDGFADKFGSVPCRFENVDTLSLNFLFSLESVLGDDGGTFVKLDGRTVVADGLEVGDLTKLPMLEKNGGLSALFSRMQDVSKRFVEQRGKCEVDPQNDGLYVELLDISAEKNRLQDQIDRELKMSFNLAKRMAAVSIAQTNETIARARAKIEEGKIKEALEILDGASVAMKRRRLLHRAAERAEAEELQIKELKANVEIEYFRVDAIMVYTAMPYDERFKKVGVIYKSIMEDLEALAPMYISKHKPVLDGMLADVVLKFAKHHAETDVDASMGLYAKAWKIFERLPSARKHIVPIRIDMAELCIREKNNDLALTILYDAKNECEAVIKHNTFRFAVCMTRIFDGMAKVYIQGGKYAEAIEVSERAVKVMDNVHLHSGGRFKERYVETLRIQGLAYESGGECEQALKIYEKALTCSLQIGFHAGVGAIANAIGDVYLKERNFYKARKYYVDALLECKHLWLDNPPLYSKIARSLAAGLGKTFMSEDFSDDVCNIFGNILTGASAGFARNLLKRLNLLGHMYQMSGWLAGAQKIFDFSYLKSCELVKNCSTEFELEISSALRHLMDVNMRMNEFEKAFQAGDESLRLRRKWDQGSLWIVSLVKRLAKIKRTLGDIKQAEELLVESRRLEESLVINSNGEHIHSEIARGKVKE